MPLFTQAYAQLQQQFHAQRPDYGTRAYRYADNVLEFARQLNTADILDYGCGKGTLQKSLPIPIQQYDPFIPEFATPPRPAALVCCFDTLEHIEPACLPDVLAHLASLTRMCLFADIATIPAQKVLPDGRNAHLIVQPGNWWIEQLLQHFELRSIQVNDKALVVLGAPLSPPPTLVELKPYMPNAIAAPAGAAA